MSPLRPASSVDSPEPASSAPASLLVTRDTWLRERVLLLCAAGGVDVDVADDLAQVSARWRSASSVLLDPAALGDDGAAPAQPQARSRRDGVVVVTREALPSTWRTAVQIGAEHVLVLPADEDALAGWLAETSEGNDGGLVVAVTGARGGAGASTLATALATTAARSRGPICIIDGDPWGGGIDLLLGDEEGGEGVRWPDLEETSGRLAGRALRDALPVLRGVCVLTWSRRDPRPASAATVRSVLAAARRAFACVVVDLQRHVDDTTAESLAAADVVLLVATDDVRSVAAASARLPDLHEHAARIDAVVRSTAVGAIPAEHVASGIGLPLLGIVPTRRSIARRMDDGAGPPRRGALVRCCRDILDALTDRAGSR